MSGFLASLIARAAPQAPRLERRRPALFEPRGGHVEPAALDDDFARTTPATSAAPEAPLTPSPQMPRTRPPASTAREVSVIGPRMPPPADIVRAASSTDEPAPASVARITTRETAARAPQADRLPAPSPAAPTPFPAQASRRPEPLPGSRRQSLARVDSLDAPADGEAAGHVIAEPMPRVSSHATVTATSASEADPLQPAVSRRQSRDGAIRAADRSPVPPIPQAMQLAQAAWPRPAASGAPVAVATQKTVQITIGRVEVRAVSAPERAAPRAPQKSAPRLSLDDYLRDRGRGSR